MVNGERVELTQNEIDALEARDTAWNATEAVQARALAAVIAERERLLRESDWTMVVDSPLKENAEWLAYRAALREVASQPDITNVTWPTKPSVSEL